MAKMQAASLSTRVVKKRKKNSSFAEDLEANPNEQAEADLKTAESNDRPGPSPTTQKAKRKRKSKDAEDAASSVSSSSGVSNLPALPWPEYFSLLEKTHRALNIVYTFCSTRKHFATTFDTIKSAVESHIKRDLTVDQVSQVKGLVPNVINFAYVDEAMLQINLLRDVDSPHNEDSDSGHREVLLFEFVDGDLKRQVRNPKTGEAAGSNRRPRDEDLKMPVFSQKQLAKRIEKRNEKFSAAVNWFLHQCQIDLRDPIERLKELGSQCYPSPTDKAPDACLECTPANLPPSIPSERKSIPEIIDEIRSLKWYSEQIVPDGHRVFDPQSAVYGDLDFQLSQSLVNAIYNTRSIIQFYVHQAEAINHLYHGNNVIVSTSTSSGKSLIYQVPVLHELEKDRDVRAMYIFPTKALAQDQKRNLKELLGLMHGLEDILVETFDGDTPMSDRNKIRDEGRVIFTNPDMLHITILPQEDSWRTFLKHLRFVVVDELHVYNGLFGAHVALIMRRLRRICAAVGNRHVKFISCSATVSNPKEHMETIFGVDNVKLTDFDGSPSGCKEFLCWNTPFKDPRDPTSGRGDSIAEAARLFCQMILRGVRVISFCRIRKQCELLISAVKTELNNLERPEVMARVMGYRGGYTPQDRRQIEREMFDGKLVGIVATNALELGIDIGSLDAVITVGFPYTIANLRQQSGRAGRRNKDSLSVLVGDCFPVDQYFMQHPDEIFTRPNCELQVDLTNMLVLEGHLQCAAHEMPIRPEDDEKYFGPLLRPICKEKMRLDDRGFFHCNERYLPRPARFVAIRDTEEDHFAIIDISHGRNVLLEELEASRAFFTIYEGGIFLHQGNTYLVKEFSQERMLARVEFVRVDWVTQQRDFTDIDPVETEAIRQIPESLSRAFYGPIKIKRVVFGFFKKDKKGRVLDAVQVDNPPIILHSKGMWLDVPKSAIDILDSRRFNIAGAIHAAEHAILSLMPNFVVSMPDDVRTECKVAQKEFAKKETTRKRPARLTFYDAKGGASGSGISTKAFEFIDLLLKQACERVSACHCLEGCLECCCSERCREANVVMCKAGAEVILKSLLNWDIDVDALPWGLDESVAAGIETVVLAPEYPNVEYKEGLSENLPFLNDETVDIVVAGQAAHWFDYRTLFPEVQRILRKGGTLAFWGYKDHVYPAFPNATRITHHYSKSLDKDLLGSYWTQPGRDIVEDKLRRIKPPEENFQDIQRIEYEPGTKGPQSGEGTMFVNRRMKIGECKEYIRTWSSYHGWQEAHPGIERRSGGGTGDVVDSLFDECAESDHEFADDGQEIEVEWGSGLIMGRKR
ncbi:P-loop containing nucleoside triphosphate hydrolase protein [Eremomyces bilateralis CBS 781.70]|uniref:P-loop containing nucleoside triphosphate hydrolase protein n=1 Tax=Eremomyces bilateralis CBS 781.70 TaxID=1392243 RepID=A0A6G1G690_9PEZI|nr:P-loop containing nucleoside triphosphate hydrolase protein [Eremomyces bilateralis CBS 781.70]KAF1813554.1 P-loop containing nucleoside triphosphate hydrolase protein [Eremomyces bilateralis CBS 781.70]